MTGVTPASGARPHGHFRAPASNTRSALLPEPARRSPSPAPARPDVLPQRRDDERRAFGPRAPEHTTAADGRGRAPSTALPLQPGPFDIHSLIAPERCSGLLVLDGLLSAQLEAGRARVTWLLGGDDLIRPWQMDELPLTQGACWQALTTATVLPVARHSGTHATQTSDLTEQLLARAARTSHWLLAQGLILSAPAIEERLLMLFALYGERWGKVTPQGIRLDMPLTHELLARLCGARRPTVTLALRSLTTEGFLARINTSTWLLPPPPETNRQHPRTPHWVDMLDLDGRRNPPWPAAAR